LGVLAEFRGAVDALGELDPGAVQGGADGRVIVGGDSTN
jgi:hypothetical protein